jgi:glutathione-specific gamma-glutamylcyclotransferase
MDPARKIATRNALLMTDTVSIAPPSISTTLQAGADDLWVFAYGSLMWRPGFRHVETQPALLRGAHRALCVYSFHHRGTPECPGLVLGLDHGGSCHGIAFRVAAADAGETRAYLTEREQISYVYRDVMRPVILRDGRRVEALAYVVERSHPQYAHGLDRADILTHIRQGHGLSGPCRDYVLSTIHSLSTLGIKDHALSWLEPALLSDSAVS